jgi:hypothetical protein
MTESFEQFSLATIRRYAALGRNPATRDYARQQVKDMERDHPEAWKGLEAKVRAAVKEQA